MDEETAGVIGSVADAAEKQADAGRDASFTDRVKMASECFNRLHTKFVYTVEPL